jgi:hypothetical protein
MPPTQRRTPGLLLRGGVWHIDKIIYAKQICESTGTRDRNRPLDLIVAREGIEQIAEGLLIMALQKGVKVTLTVTPSCF